MFSSGDCSLPFQRSIFQYYIWFSVAKRSDSGARAFNATVDALRSCNDLPNADDVIRFIIMCGSGRTAERISQRNARVAAANAALLNDLRTPSKSPSSTISSHSTKTLFATATPSSACSATTYSFNSKTFLPVEVRTMPKKSPVLTGRCKGRTAVSNEEMVRQLLSALLGSEGRYITRGGAPGDRLVIAKHCAVDDALHAQIESLLCVANAFYDVQHVAQRQKSDLLTKAFILCLSDVISEYIAIVSKLESHVWIESKKSSSEVPFLGSLYMVQCILQLTILRESVTPLAIYYGLGDWQLRMQYLAHIAMKSGEMKGTAILNAIYTAYCCTPRDSPMRSSLRHILRAMLAVFHEALRDWLLYGRLNQTGNEWMIMKEESARAGDPWNDGYRINREAIPVFFTDFPKIFQKILVIGKSVALLSSMAAADHSLAERRHLFSMFDPLECYYLPSQMQKFLRTVNGLVDKFEAFYERINMEVIRNVVIESNMRTHAELVQNHFLLVDENLARTFYTQIIEETGGDMSVLDSQKVCRALSSAKAACDSWPAAFATVARIDATCGLMEDELGILPSPRDSNGGPIVQLRYTANAPVSIIFNEAAIERYQRAFTFIWTVLCCDFQLADVNEKYSLSSSDASSIWPGFLHLCRLFSSVFARMAQFLCVLRFHITYSVTTIYTQRFNMELNEWSNDLDKLINAHQLCLRGLEEGLFLSESCRLAASVRNRSASTLIGHDLNDTARFELEEENIRVEDVFQQINFAYLPLIRNIDDKFVRQMRTLVDEMLQREEGMNLSNLAMQLDFTDYYHRNVGLKTKT
ncbi:unnamed protein product [Toxocara canis]|uniref:Gamma-tubulin complex component n=1 Tax=Toxocara canis TaxID=6265 RepID=A0A183UAJ2_TOXCA|nr:unnamed protein product [Toxocara canis]